VSGAWAVELPLLAPTYFSDPRSSLRSMPLTRFLTRSAPFFAHAPLTCSVHKRLKLIRFLIYTATVLVMMKIIISRWLSACDAYREWCLTTTWFDISTPVRRWATPRRSVPTRPVHLRQIAWLSYAALSAVIDFSISLFQTKNRVDTIEILRHAHKRTRSSAIADRPPDAINILRDNWPMVTSCAVNRR